MPRVISRKADKVLRFIAESREPGVTHDDVVKRFGKRSADRCVQELVDVGFLISPGRQPSPGSKFAEPADWEQQDEPDWASRIISIVAIVIGLAAIALRIWARYQ